MAFFSKASNYNSTQQDCLIDGKVKICKTGPLTSEERIQLLSLINDKKDILLCKDGKSDAVKRKNAVWTMVTYDLIIFDLLAHTCILLHSPANNYIQLKQKIHTNLVRLR